MFPINRARIVRLGYFGEETVTPNSTDPETDSEAPPENNTGAVTTEPTTNEAEPPNGGADSSKDEPSVTTPPAEAEEGQAPVQWIPGVSNKTVIIGGVALLLGALLLKGK